MGMMICSIHGGTGLTPVSSDIAEDYYLNINKGPSQKYYEVLAFIFDDEPELWCWCSTEMASKFDLPLNKVLTGDELLKYDNLPLRTLCMDCFQEWLDKNDLHNE